jgi:hypothetical protein
MPSKTPIPLRSFLFCGGRLSYRTRHPPHILHVFPKLVRLVHFFGVEFHARHPPLEEGFILLFELSGAFF